MSKGNMHRLETIKDKNIWRRRGGKRRNKIKLFLLQILAVIGRYGPHFMIVMVFVTQNNLKRSRNFRPSPWIWARQTGNHSVRVGPNLLVKWVPHWTHCTPPKPHKLAKQLPVCSVHLTRLLPGGSYFYFYTSLMGPRHPTAARWNKQF